MIIPEYYMRNVPYFSSPELSQYFMNLTPLRQTDKQTSPWFVNWRNSAVQLKTKEICEFFASTEQYLQEADRIDSMEKLRNFEQRLECTTL